MVFLECYDGITNSVDPDLTAPKVSKSVCPLVHIYIYIFFIFFYFFYFIFFFFCCFWACNISKRKIIIVDVKFHLFLLTFKYVF